MGVEGQTRREMHQIAAAQDTQSTSAVTHKLCSDEQIGEHVEIFSLVEGVDSKSK